MKPRTRPTRSGEILILILIAMAVASTNYGNNMAYILTFLVLGIFLTARVQTRNNLKGVVIENVQPQPAFAGSEVRFSLELHNKLSGKRFAIYLVPQGAKSQADIFGPFTVEPFSSTTAEIALPAPRRGRFALSHLGVVTVYPLGLFRAWGNLEIGKEYLVFPKPAGFRPWPEPEADPEGNGNGFHPRGGDDFVGTRPYRIGESQHHVDWKAFARGGPMSVKVFTGGGASRLWFDFTRLAGMGTEGRLSQLCRWVLEADEQGSEFGLKLLEQTIGMGSGSVHTRRCLNALALFGA